MFEAVDAALGHRTLAVWEGDAVTLRPIGKNMRRWFRRADVVFSQYGQPQPQKLLRLGAKRVHHLPATYCHVRFRQLEQTAPPKEFSSDVAMIASRNRNWTSWSGITGSRTRAQLGFDLRASGRRLDLFGNGWPEKWGVGPVDFGKQGEIIRRNRISVNWDITPGYADSSSNRLPISLIAGRPHITTRHRGMEWIPSQDIGLFEEVSRADVVQRANELLTRDDEVLFQLGLSAHRWAKGRVSHREAIRYMLQVMGYETTPVPQDPWGSLPGPWVQSEKN
ncbi:hypothetical protein [Arthrobacter crystallopoietes]|uniref:hypothetical protein n=1 Tax=Crystallibacter crystallopoietes TaxID=37928 RepID=UPI00111108FC|nr:hypothetical protein [Arthrobacter crystallopoietes]